MKFEDAIRVAKNPRVVAASITVASTVLVGTLTREEGVRYVPYYDTVGVRTVCVGSTSNVRERRYSPEECNERLRQDIRTHNPLACIHVPISQTEYEAYADLAFNIGMRQFCGSTLVKLLNDYQYEAACRQILRWVKQPELKPRRERTYQKCITPVDTVETKNDKQLKIATEPEDRGPLILKPARSLWSWFVGRGGVAAGPTS